MAESISTIDDFVNVVKKSGLVDEARLDEALAAWPDRSQPLPDELVAKLVEAELLTQWQVDQLRKGKHRGFLLGKYKLLRLLGAGGMSSVYLAEHVNLHGKVAIKVLPLKNVDKTSYLARFEREAREAFRLSHANIVRATDLDTSGAIHYLVMEYVEGIDLHAKVKQDGPLSIRDAVDSVRQAALGLQYAHEEGVVHRDIKPANLILDKRGTIKILDFGLALAGKGDDDGSLTQEFGEKILGTADYLAPEQARDSHQADSRCDIYALGCTLYYLLVGKVPFAGGKLADRIRAHETKPPPNLLDERPDAPPAIVELYFRMLAKHPEARPQTAKEVADALGAWLAASAAAAGPTPPPRRLPPRRSAGQAAGVVPTGVGPLVLASPGSAGVRRPPASGVGPGGFVFAPPPASGAGRSGSKPQASGGKTSGKTKGKAKPKAAANRASDDANEADKPARPRRSLSFAGLPLGFWIAALAGVVLAIGLGVMVINKQQARVKKAEAKAKSSNVEKGAAAAKTPDGGTEAADEPTKPETGDEPKKPETPEEPKKNGTATDQKKPAAAADPKKPGTAAVK